MSTNKINFLQSIKLGAWWYLLCIFPAALFVIGLCFLLLNFYKFMMLNPTYALSLMSDPKHFKIGLVALYALSILIVIFYTTYFFYKIFPVETCKSQIQMIKKIRFRRIFMYNFLLTSIQLAINALIADFLIPSLYNPELIRDHTKTVLMFSQIILLLASVIFLSMLLYSFIVYLVIKRNPDCFEVTPVSDKEVVEGN